MIDVNMKRVGKVVQFAIKEDVWTGDITSEALIDPKRQIDAVIIAREKGMICGVKVAEKAFNLVDPESRFKHLVKDGDHVEPDQEIAFVEGNALSVLRSERVAINFLSYLSGIATETNKMVTAVAGTKAEIYDTRKTMPLHRYLQKYAVRVGGGKNHRWGLWDMVLIKDNHLRIYAMQKKSSNNENIIRNAIKDAKESVQKNISIEIEVENLNECKYALVEKPHIIMLDNMSAEDVKKAVSLRREMGLEGEVIFEVSGGMNLENVKAYAETGVERISSGAITSRIKSVDFSLEIVLRA